MADDKKSKEDRFWSRLIWISTDEFVSPYSMDECIQRLENLAKAFEDNRRSNLFLPSPEYKIEGMQNNGGIFNFEASGQMSKVLFEPDAIGQLIYIDNTQTQIKFCTGYARSSLMIFLGIFIFCIIISIFVTPHPTSGSVLLASFIVTISFVIFAVIVVLLTNLPFTYMLQSQLRHSLHKALTAPSTPRPNTLPQ